MRRLRLLVVRILAAWLVIGFFLVIVVYAMMNVGWVRVSSPIPVSRSHSVDGILFFVALCGILVVVSFREKAKDLLDRLVAGFFLVFHSFPVLAFFLEPELYIMVIPFGIFAFLCAPWNPLVVCSPVWSLLGAPLLNETYRNSVFVLGVFLFPAGFCLFSVSFIQLLRGKGKLVISGLYSIVRHPQYLGIILATFGFTFFDPEIRVISVISWIMLVLAYIWLARREETTLKQKYGEEYLAYKNRVPFILPFPAKRREKLERSKTPAKVVIPTS